MLLCHVLCGLNEHGAFSGKYMICGTHCASAVFHFVIVRGLGRNTWFGFELRRSGVVDHLTFDYEA